MYAPMNTRVATCALVLLSLAGAVRTLADEPARPLPPQTGIPAIRNFDPSDYRAGQQNFAVVQDARGVLYAGNADGVLEYDGVRWHLIPTAPGGATITTRRRCPGASRLGAK